MIWVDYGILIILALSALISVMRGFVREALSLAAWVAAFWVAFTFHQHLATVFTNFIDAPSIRLIAAFTLLFVVTLIICALVNNLVAQLVKKTGLSGTDRMLGVLFGIARGAVVVAILVLLAGLTPIPADPWWKESIFIIHFQSMAIWLRDLLPPDIAANFQYA
ncbi:CvpA family protein [Sulfuriflexus mobilis]|uniref:CvpA family protein n=1 Tax=Sulfuriflexus mobilis TaxID=1811807 RepID=UPI000F840E3C|nr:CvpA family protein [Sulfuriflexus mobilis]